VVRENREQYSKYIKSVDEKNDSEELVNITTTDWYKKMNTEMKPKEYLKTHEEYAV
jgi:hypothetical protein